MSKSDPQFVTARAMLLGFSMTRESGYDPARSSSVPVDLTEIDFQFLGPFVLRRSV